MILYVVLGGTGGYPSFFLCNIKKNGCCGVCCNNAGGRKKRLFEYFLEKKDTEYFVNYKICVTLHPLRIPKGWKNASLAQLARARDL